MEQSWFGRSVVVGVDAGSDWENVLDHGLFLARRQGLGVHVVFVVEEPGRSMRRAFDAETLELHLRELERQGRERIQAHLEEAAGDVSTQLHVLKGSPAEELLRVTAETQAGLTVIGVRRSLEGSRRPMGTEADRVVRMNEVPTMVVFREAPRPPARILVPVDMDAPDEVAVRLARDLAEESSAEVTVLHAFPVPSLLHGYLGNVADLRDKARDRARSALDEFLGGLKLPEGTPGLQVVLKSESDSVHPAEVVACEAERLSIDLIVMAMGRSSILKQYVLGGTAEKLLGLLPCHLLALPAAWAHGR